MSYQDKSLGGQIFEKIREDILTGVYERGEELKEATLGTKLGVSRTPVREALRQLELEGLVEIIPNRGARVTGISDKDVYDIYQMRLNLEGMAARWAAKNCREEDLAKMEEAVLLSEIYLKDAKQEQVVRMDGRFHEILYYASGSRMLEHVLSDFHHYVKKDRGNSIRAKERAEKSVQEHRKILEAVRNRDGNLAEQAAREHIRHVIENLNLKSRDAAEPD